jgi:hypothetical protein
MVDMNMYKIGMLVTIVGTICFIWFLVCFAIYKWGTNDINLAVGIMGSILVVGGLNIMQGKKR